MVYLIARREFISRVRSRFFLIGTVVVMVVLAGYIVLQTAVIGRAVTTVKVGFTPEAQALAQPLKTAAGADPTLKVETSSVAGTAAGDDDVRSGALDAVVSGDPAAPDVAVKDDLNPAVAATLDGLVKEVALNRALAATGADPSVIEGKVAAASIHLIALDPNAAVRAQRLVVGVFVAALLYVALVIYGQLIAAGIVEEKANRIIEILLSTVRPRQMLFGKVIGIGLMGFVQLLLLGVVGVITLRFAQAISVPSVGVSAAAGGLLWFVLGFLFYGLIYAAAGSMVSRQEDIAAVTTPITMLVVGTYLAFFWVVANPDNPLAVLLSVLPPFSPVLMPARIATGDAQLWHIAVAVVLMLIAIAGLNTIAARIYTNSVLRVGSRVSLVQAWRGRD